ncbi:MAG: BMP family ABC transporter substrate-binding protein [Erysipelotrichaceae bacterium]|nr:BMP family ABC transporter substrate-binding protein [Erysipelotrichaceae bacterium]
MKKVVSLVLAVTMLMAVLSGCTKKPEPQPQDQKLKLGFVLVGDENEGYTFAHMEGIEKAAEAVGNIEIVYKKNVGETEACKDAIVDLLENGCKAVFTNSYGHQSFAQEVAQDYPDNPIVAATGDTAAISGLKNFSNAFTNVYESRYVSGVVAGMKLAELVKDGKLIEANYDANGNIKIGYVGAYTYAEVVSGFTAFYLGIKSIVPNVAMEVTYTGSWFDITAEAEAAKMLMADHCVIIGQHADSTGAPSAVQAELEKGGEEVHYSIGYNVDMLSVAPQAALTSATNNWAIYYEYAFRQIVAGERIAVDWAKGYTDNAVAITKLGESCAPGTAEKVEEVIAAIKAGTLHVFDTSTWTLNGEHLSELVIDLDGDFKTDSAADKNAIFDGYFHESEFRSAPSFSVIIDGITNLNEVY